MDSLTQIVLGASVGELVLGKRVGRRAPLWGALVGTLPDLDVISRVFLGEFEYLMAHRGVTHSLLFCIVASPILGWLIHRSYRERWGTAKGWTWLVFWCLLTHTLLDCFTNWGTQLFYPLSDFRVAWSTISVVDPLYTLPFLVCVLVAVCLRKESRWRSFWNKIGLIISTLYLVLTVTNKLVVDAVFTNSMHRQGKSIIYYDTYPTMFNNALWYVVAREPSGFNIGYYSVFDKSDNVDFTYLPTPVVLTEDEQNGYLASRMQWLSNQHYRVVVRGDKKYWQDLRFGLKGFWNPPPLKNDPLFEYEMIYEGDTHIDVRQVSPTSEDLSQVSFRKLWQRMMGLPFNQSPSQVLPQTKLPQ